ncbi:proline--tRNA ligase [Dictyobacter alpinus]|uniref:Proline--tRNA ligase n=1 Tax=Dictyobacter alpinus TaxID=2014873 RepID=A0A402B2D7_9CHLR|nr:proline--tRNA ligase [Dictyobacter alpinus]GCE25524.1 proline--tRNA ligase [Dictyobacter alpinus]
MRISQQLTTTLREVPRESEGVNQELLVRAGFMRQLTSGVYSFLPLGNRVIQKISTIVREEMDRAGGQEVIMPVIQPRDIWEVKPADGGPSRAEGVDVLFQLKDRKGRNMVLGPTHEEVVTLLAKEFVRSYRDLPQLVYQIQVKLRDEPRPRGGLLRTREFLMKDLYSFDADEAGMDRSYRALSQAYSAIFNRCGLRFIVIQADSGAIGGKDSQEFIAITDAGEDDAVECDTCGYAANTEKAEFVRSELESESEVALEEVHTPNASSIEDLAAFLKIPAAKTMKVVCYGAGGKMVLAAVRGDLEVNEVKLTNALRRAGIAASDLHLATPEELQRAGIVAGFTSPLNKDKDIFIMADTSLKSGNNFVAGANKVDYHVKNVNYPRDFRVDAWEDLASAYDGARCAVCGGTLHVVRGSELGHIFKLGTRYSVPFGATFLDAQGNEKPLLMGCYGIGIGRLMAIAVEQSHDEKGIIWPFGIAPYQLALVGLDLDKGDNGQLAEQLYEDLQAAGVEVLFDDRIESAGVKFNDADLLGLPLRAVLSKRSIKNGGIELKLRSQKESRIVPLAEAVQVIKNEIQQGLKQD